ncbi:fluoride efflux transporter CrcB [Streptomyces sp. DSM 42041]|uniref:Fluoride-specific ion channel FluC n=1 Tax=Streptomyces hazeniae TaxID=3075538 RepID=A0ABU2NU72_9ACTN|nr:fluoride efflux transporter CrcB [Streptomyces sp. DSM 42041]MDT0379763.1 fluoride efflux transporter CrcB [Streptomyces sp. DSM 42041]
MTWLWVALGGALGAPLRYLADRAVQSRHATDFPWGTFAVNVTGCLALGLLTGAVLGGSGAGDDVQALLGTGLCGALTTYSTFSWETLRLAESGRGVLAGANVAASVCAGTGAAAAGLVLTGAV